MAMQLSPPQSCLLWWSTVEKQRGMPLLVRSLQLPYFWDAPTIVDWNTPIAGIVILLRMGTDGQHDRDASVEFTMSPRAKLRSGLRWMLSIRS
ncbi:hypothetical protein BKA82DRAFT_1006593 [Pisolithus tinctorius]|nr:hypothetical protein BKA82DRAFT_1006593 [Pisolithus tinctorius]